MKVKKVNEHPMQVELAELNKLTRYVIEQRDLLSQVEVESLDALEISMQSKTGYVKPSLNAELLGLEKEHYRLTELERILDGKLEDSDVDANGNLTKKLLDAIREKHTVYWTEDELKLNKQLQKVVDVYNALPPQHRNKVIITRTGDMIINPILSRY